MAGCFPALERLTCWSEEVVNSPAKAMGFGFQAIFHWKLLIFVDQDSSWRQVQMLLYQPIFFFHDLDQPKKQNNFGEKILAPRFQGTRFCCHLRLCCCGLCDDVVPPTASGAGGCVLESGWRVIIVGKKKHEHFVDWAKNCAWNVVS